MSDAKEQSELGNKALSYALLGSLAYNKELYKLPKKAYRIVINDEVYYETEQTVVMTFTYNLLILPLLCLSISSIAKNLEDTSSFHISDFSAEYVITRNDSKIGKGVRKLQNLPNNHVKFSYETEINWFIFSDYRKEDTTVKIINNLVIPLDYHSLREGTGRNKYYSWGFDQNKSVVTNNKLQTPIEIIWPEGLQSKLSYQLQYRLNLINNNEDFSFQVLSTSGKISEYDFEFIKEEKMKTKLGEFSVLKYQRKRSNSKRITFIWFAPKLDYLMIKLYQFESKLNQFSAELSALELTESN